MVRKGKCRKLRRAIESFSGEREVHRQLEANPWVFFPLFQYSYRGFVVSHFSLGDEFEADFVVITAYSGGWFVYFVELEPPSLVRSQSLRWENFGSGRLEKFETQCNGSFPVLY
jgi:hypothetical protein